MTVKPIETQYNGYNFRSRLEARTAVFFDIIKVPYAYEFEGYNLESGRYLPDFTLFTHNCFVEIKPDNYEFSKENLTKMIDLAKVTKKSVIVISGDPYDYTFAVCESGRYSVFDSGISLLFDIDKRKVIFTDKKSQLYINAAKKAREERFEKPAIVVAKSKVINKDEVTKILFSALGELDFCKHVLKKHTCSFLHSLNEDFDVWGHLTDAQFPHLIKNYKIALNLEPRLPSFESLSINLQMQS